MADTPRLEVLGLTRHFDGFTAVNGVSFSVEPGRILCLLGPSGCGKSTTLRMIAGMEYADSGEIRLGGVLATGSGVHLPPEQRGVGLIFQDFALFPHLNVEQNVGFGLPRAKRASHVPSLLERIGLSDRAHRYPHELSGGEQQRVALARALAPEPSVMLMDEPFSSLDDRLRDEVRDATLEILRESGAAVMLVTHDPGEAMRLGDSIALMRKGKIVQEGSPYTIYNNPVDLEAAAFFSDVNVVPGRVKDGLCDTAFGQFFVPGGAASADVDIVIRPQHLGVDFDRGGRGPNPTERGGVPARGIVERARFMGRESLVEFRMDHDGSQLKATVPGVFLPEPGRALWLTIRRERCFVFPRN